jgi:hypothetical protein
LKVVVVAQVAIQDPVATAVCVLRTPVQVQAVADLAELVPTAALVAVVVALVCLVQDQTVHSETIMAPALV